MGLKELLENNKSYILYIVIGLVIVLLFFIIARSTKKSKLKNMAEKFHFRLNKLNSYPFNVQLAQSEGLARVNKEVKEQLVNCKADFAAVNVNCKKILELIEDLDEDAALGHLKEASNEASECEALLAQTESKAEGLEAVLKSILDKNSSYIDRNTNLQMQFHAIKETINANPNLYADCWEGIDGLSSKISAEFSNMRAAMDFQKYDEADQYVNDLVNDINHFDVIVKEIPELIKVARSEMPAAIKEIGQLYASVSAKGAYLEHLDVKRNIEAINSSLTADIANIQKCQIENVNNNLLDYETRLNQLRNAIEKESQAHKEVSTLLASTENTLKIMNRYITNMTNNWTMLIHNYGCEPNEEGFHTVRENLKELSEEYKSLTESFLAKSVPSTTLIISVTQLAKAVNVNMAEAKKYVDFYSKAQADERKAREEVEKYTVVINEIKAAIRLNNLPTISNTYEEDLLMAEGYINRLNEILAVVPLDTASLMSTLDKTVDFICSLHENVNRLIGLSTDIENYILLGNRYRPYLSEADSELTRAELNYRNGEYTKGWSVAKDLLNKIDPKLVEKAIKGKEA